MKKSDQRGLKVSFAVGNVPGVKSRKSDKELNASEKPERQHTSRVKFKDSVGSGTVKNVKSVQFVRNTTVPLRAGSSTVSFVPGLNKELSGAKEKSDNTAVGGLTGDNDIRLDVPELCSSIRFANKLLDEAVCRSKTAIRLKNEACASRAKSKVLRKLNIPFEEQIYKDLVDLRVNESELFPEHEKKSRAKQFIRNKEKEPELSDFYKPSFNQEFFIKPEKVKVEPEKIIHYNGFSISDRTKRWDSS